MLIIIVDYRNGQHSGLCIWNYIALIESTAKGYDFEGIIGILKVHWLYGRWLELTRKPVRLYDYPLFDTTFSGRLQCYIPHYPVVMIA